MRLGRAYCSCKSAAVGADMTCMSPHTVHAVHAAQAVEVRTEGVAGFDMSAANLYRWHPAYAAGVPLWLECMATGVEAHEKVAAGPCLMCLA